MLFLNQTLFRRVALMIAILFPSVAAASGAGGLSYDVLWQKNYAGGNLPGLVLRAKPKTVLMPDPTGVVPLLQFPLERDLEAQDVLAYMGQCQLHQGLRFVSKPVSAAKLAQKYVSLLTAHGDWNGDGLTDLFFIAEVQVFMPSRMPRYCGFQLVNRGSGNLPEVKVAAKAAESEDPYGLGGVVGLEAQDLDGDGRDDLIMHYKDSGHVPAVSFYANGSGELFGEGSWNATYVPPAELVGSEVPEADLLPRVVGATGGSHTVGVDGSASYAIPIATPAAAGGQQPALAFSYNSNGGNGQLGFGWSLGGMSAIQRCGKTLRQDGIASGIKLTEEDELCLDGQRLVLVGGKHDQDGSEYRLENEVLARVVLRGNLQGIVAGGSNPVMQVFAPDGSLSTYGQAVLANGGSNGVPMEWLLTESCDRWWNCTEYRYAVDNENGSYRLEAVDYGGNRNPDAGARLPHTHHVKLDYSPRSHGYQGYIAGSKMSGNHLLETVTILERQQGNPPKKPPGSKVENSRNMTRGGSTCANRSLLTVRYWRS